MQTTEFWSITVGNVIEILAMFAGGVVFLISVGVKLGQIVTRLANVEHRLADLENQNTLPIHERRRAIQ